MLSNNNTNTTNHSNTKIQTAVLVFGFLLMVTKFLAYYITHSAAILTDALESIVNVIAGGITLYSIILSALPKDDNHPYGHGKAEFVSAGIEGALITFAGISILFRAIYSFLHPIPLHQLNVGIWLIAFTAAFNYFMGYLCKKYGKKNNSIALTAGGEHLQTDTYTTIGVIVALILVKITNIYSIDGIIAIALGILFCSTGYKIIRKSLAGIMDEADEEIITQLIKVLNAHRHPNWIDMHNFRVIKYGAILHIDCHVTLPWYFNVQEAHDDIEQIQKIIGDNIGAVEFFIHTDPCLPPESCKVCSKTDCTSRQKDFERLVIWQLDNITANQKHFL